MVGVGWGRVDDREFEVAGRERGTGIEELEAWPKREDVVRLEAIDDVCAGVGRNGELGVGVRIGEKNGLS